MQTQVESYVWSEPGYQPLLFSDGWQVAILKWETSMEPQNVVEIERHMNTDEVFILGQGHAALYTKIEDEIQIVNLEAGILYNVPKGRWHNLVASRGSFLWIVENSGTHLYDTEICKLNSDQRSRIQSLLPLWGSDSSGMHP